jgi:O-antigen ligase
MSESRSAILAVAVGVTITLLRGGVSEVIRATTAAVCIVIIAFFAQLFGLGFGSSQTVAAINRFGANEGGSLLNARTDAWSSAIQLWQSRPLTGYGYQAGEFLFVQRFESGLIAFGRASVHNSYLQYILELGLLGSVVLIVLVTVALVAWLRETPIGLGSGLMATVSAGLLLTITESSLFGTGQVFPYVFWAAVAAALIRSELRAPGDRHQLSVLSSGNPQFGATRIAVSEPSA